MKYDTGHITEIAGYRLTQRIGSGGMGDVFKAYNEALNRTAAVKVLHQKEMSDRFRNEAYIQSSVSHPNIARLYEYLVTGETACIIMEYVEGESLDVYRHRKTRLSNSETENIVKQIASALAYLHSREIVHRDIKPQNFKIQPTGTVTMLDFGISKNQYTPKLTKQGYMVGTTDYMAPEQFKEQVDRRSDIWSLGVLTYEMVTGFMPFEANNAIVMRAKIEKADFTKPNVLVPAVSEKLGIIIEKCLQANPSNRLSAQDIANLLTDKKPGSIQVKKSSLPDFINFKSVGIAAVIILVIALMVFVSNKPAQEEPRATKNKTVQKQRSNTVQKLVIDVPNASNAFIVFPDGNKKKLPFEISGVEGENFTFTLQAEGHVSRKIEVPIKIGRKSYEYNLDKIKE